MPSPTRSPAADVAVQIQPDGSLLVQERISFDYSGDFSGAYRDIPLRAGESIDQVGVSEGGDDYIPGANTELGSFGVPGSFGVEQSSKLVRIVWHYRATRRAPDVHDQLPLSGPRRRVRRRRRRQSPGLGGRVEGLARLAERSDAASPRNSPRAFLPRVGKPRLGAGRRRPSPERSDPAGRERPGRSSSSSSE